jgi:hypothetical protein
MRGIPALVVMLGSLHAGVIPARAQATTPKVEAAVTRHDFGAVPPGTVVKKAFVIRNQGSAPLIIRRADISEPNLRLRVSQEIAPGGATELELTWDTSRVTGDLQGQAVLHVNDPRMPRLSFTLVGVVVSPIDVLPVPAFYLSQFKGDSATQEITIRNNQERALTITRVEPQGAHFSATLETIEPGKTFRLTAAGAAAAPVGRYQEQVIVHTDDPSQPRLRVEVNLLVKPAVFVTIDAVEFGQISLSSVRLNPSSLDLLAQSFLVTRRQGTLRIVRMESDLPFLRPSAELGTDSRTVRVDVGLDSASLTPGIYHGRLRLFTDDQEFPELFVPVQAAVIK